ncbi:LAMI_0H02652g1_1 [Lachancea mirantina]|uniref:LAMI_0H02652g1_1 n=1 Tax=Lachancea mirantina TaxID=1230905 RepID=A0A1G4KE53_9SACH|nr:LAMI_0H02652g1_1 [Lachancea mirantina]
MILRRQWIRTFNQIRRYSEAIPNCKVQWYYATDVPNKKPFEPEYSRGEKEPKKFLAFSQTDSRRLERFYQLFKSKDEAESSAFKAIPVNEDYLFEVDLSNKELRPTYWEGPVYEVRRGLWFNSDGLPLQDSLTKEVENLYQKVHRHKQELQASSQLTKNNGKEPDQDPHRDLFKLSGNKNLGKYVFFSDDKTAFILPALYGGSLQLNWLRSNVTQAVRFGITKLTRGVDADTNILDAAKESVEKEVEETSKGLGKLTDMINWEMFGFMSGLNPLVGSSKRPRTERDADKAMEKEIETDYNGGESTKRNSTSNHRDVDHLVFCVHGIGQNLGKKYQYVNFAHTVNLLRQNMKKAYENSDKLKELNKANGQEDWSANCRAQVIPITWRHRIGFKTDDYDINTEDVTLPTLNDITPDGVKSLRKVLGDVVLDVLLYGERQYKHRILTAVTSQLNHLYNLYCSRNPGFNGKVHIVGHSLGSLILFDILANQKQYALDFDVHNFFTIGSPVGVFKLIQKSRLRGSLDESSAKYQSPKCQNFYNVFHVCDPIAYRVEPLVDRSLASIQPAYMPHWTSNDITSKVYELGTSLISSDPQKDQKLSTVLTARQLALLTDINASGRIDYSFLPNFLEVDLISAIRAHVSYFEEMDMAAFLLRELLSKRPRVTNQVRARKKTEPDAHE